MSKSVWVIICLESIRNSSNLTFFVSDSGLFWLTLLSTATFARGDVYLKQCTSIMSHQSRGPWFIRSTPDRWGCFLMALLTISQFIIYLISYQINMISPLQSYLAELLQQNNATEATFVQDRCPSPARSAKPKVAPVDTCIQVERRSKIVQRRQSRREDSLYKMSHPVLGRPSSSLYNRNDLLRDKEKNVIAATTAWSD